ncbi:MAG: CotH kinase family protein [Eubacterium sp.]|nr:CotH kinase family protein [Eubacterium sp.]
MSTSRHIDKICCVVLALVILLTVVFVYAERFGITAATACMGYEQRLFDTSRVHTVDIVMDDWDGFLDTCENEEYTLCSTVIDNEAYQNIGIRAKGNTSLSMVSQYGNDRYSFKLEFDHYDKGKSYYGLDKLSLNNIIQDNTYMKDYLTYQMMGYFGVNAPLCSYVYVTVNGEDWGLYLAVEGVEEGFLERNFGKSYGELYKPDHVNMGGGRGNGGAFDMQQFRKEHPTTDTSGADDEKDSVEVSDEKDSAEVSDELEAPPGMSPPDEAGLPDGAKLPDGVNLPDGLEAPSGMELPDGVNPPSGMELPDGFGAPPEMELSDGEGISAGQESSDDEESMTGQKSATGQEAAAGAGQQSDEIKNARPERPTAGFPGKGMGGKKSDDVSLIYTDDEYESYNNIFDNAKTDITDADKDRLIRSLKAMNEGTDIEEVVNIEEVIRYFVVHNFVCNFDSYTGSMIHNYYLYEENGQMSMIPWDYNLAFGGFQSQSDADGLINYPIDTPVSGGDVDSRPMLAWMLNSESYTQQYHAYFAQFIEEYFESGYFEQMIDTVTALIAPYVEKDPTKFCTYEQFQTGAETLKQFCLLRAESVRGQLEGTIPSTQEGQEQDAAARIDGSSVKISDMGTMGNGIGGRTEKKNGQEQQESAGSGQTQKKQTQAGTTGG